MHVKEAPAGTRSAAERREAASQQPVSSAVDARPATAHKPCQGPQVEFREMVGELVLCRGLLWQMVLRDLRLRYKQAAMGFGWALFMPMAAIAAGFMVKFAMTHVAGGGFDVGGFAGLALKATAWSFFIGAIGFATSSLTTNINLVTKIYFPREVFPLSSVLTQAVDSGIGVSVLVVLLAFVGVRPSWTLLWVPVLVGMLVLFTAAAALCLSCANVFFRDVKYIVQVFLMFGMFFTPVFYEPAQFGRSGVLLLMLNPLAPLLEGLRLSVLEGHNLLTPLIAANGTPIWEPWYLAYAVAWSVLGFLAAWRLFHRLEFVFAEYI